MSNNLNVHVTSGQVSIGGISQGDHADVHGQSIQSVTIDAALQRMQSQLAETAARQQIPADALKSVQAQSKAVAEAAKSGDMGAGLKALAIIKEHFAWAYPPLKDFLKVAWPALLGLLV